MNYFEFYQIPISFEIDAKALKRIFYSNSKKYHPDFYTLETKEKQQEILALSTLNNQAYKTLNDFDKRMKYILELKNVLAEEGKNQIPQDFLMEMMDINEELMELQFDYNQDNYNKVLAALLQEENNAFDQIKSIIENYQDNKSNEEELSAIKDYYLKKRYLLRIKENLDKFAAL